MSNIFYFLITSSIFVAGIIYFTEPYHVLFFISLSLIVFSYNKMRPFFISKNWVHARAEIISIIDNYKNVALSEYQEIKYYFPEIKYKYKHKNKTYTSDASGVLKVP